MYGRGQIRQDDAQVYRYRLQFLQIHDCFLNLLGFQCVPFLKLGHGRELVNQLEVRFTALLQVSHGIIIFHFVSLFGLTIAIGQPCEGE